MAVAGFRRRVNPLAVVIPVYNGREFLLEAVDSVLNQTRPVDEIWVVDDGSTDGSADLLANRGDRVRVLRKTNGGVASARNAGVRATTAEWVALLDADDAWEAEKVARFAATAARCPAARWFYSDARQVDRLGRPGRFIRADRASGVSDFEALLLKNHVVTSSAVFHRETALSVGLFREDFTCRAGVEDWEFFLRLAKAAPGARVPGAWTRYRHHPASAIQTQRLGLREDALRVVALHAADAPTSVAARARDRVFYESAFRHLAARDAAAARRDLGRVRFFSPLKIRAVILWVLSWAGGNALDRLAGLRRRWMSRR